MRELGLVYHPKWLSAADEARLLPFIDAQPWQGDLSRRVQHYGWRYDYSARRVRRDMKLGPLPGPIASLAERLADCGIFERAPDQVIVNEYLPGPGIAPHTDCLPCFGDAIASLSLGSAATMRLISPDNRNEDIRLAPRSLLVFKNAVRREWKHGIAKRKSDIVDGMRVMRGRRVSLTFRNVVLG